MYCILVTGIPAAGKSTTADFLSRRFDLPVFSKDRIKERLFDDIGFSSREEKVRLGVASLHILYEVAEQMMRSNQPFILENNFETLSEAPLRRLLEKYAYTAITVTLTGDYAKIYRRYVERNGSPDRHRGHVVNDVYPEPEPNRAVPPLSYAEYVGGIRSRGMDRFVGNGPHIVVDATDLDARHMESWAEKIQDCMEQLS